VSSRLPGKSISTVSTPRTCLIEVSSAADSAGRTWKGSEPAAAISMALCWGSASKTMTLPELSSMAAARLSATVVFPTPPFWFATGMHHGREPGISVMPAMLQSPYLRSL